MKFIKGVRGSKNLAVPLVIQKTIVYIKKNIKKIETELEDFELYEWDEYQYTINEYIKLLQEEMFQKDIDNKEAIIELYEMVIKK